MSFINVMKLLLWKSRGTANKTFRRISRDFLRVQKPSIFVVVEPLVCGPKAERILRRLGFGRYCIADPVGLTGGVWLYWDDKIITP